MLADPTFLALASALCFGLALVLTQFGFRLMTPAQATLIAVPSSTLLLWLLSPWLVDWQGFATRPALIFAGVGLLYPAAVTLLTFLANRRMGPNVAGALGNLAPLFALLLAAILFGEVPSAWQGAGVAAIILGVALISWTRERGEGAWPWWAVALPLGAAAVRGIIQPISKLGLALWPSPFAAVLVSYTVSSAIIIGAGSLGSGARAPLKPAGVAWFVVIGWCNVAAVAFLYAALAHGSVTLVSPLVSTYPLATLALSAALLRAERIDLRLAGAVALTVAGVIILIAAR